MGRTDNVEWHNGWRAYRDGLSPSANPYLVGGERFARWEAGWNASARQWIADGDETVSGEVE